MVHDKQKAVCCPHQRRSHKFGNNRPRSVHNGLTSPDGNSHLRCRDTNEYTQMCKLQNESISVDVFRMQVCRSLQMFVFECENTCNHENFSEDHLVDDFGILEGFGQRASPFLSVVRCQCLCAHACSGQIEFCSRWMAV